MKTLSLRFPAAGLIVCASAFVPFGCDSGSAGKVNAGEGSGGTTSVPGDNGGNGNGKGDGGLGGAGGNSWNGVAPCISDKDCTSAGQICDFDRHVCAECLTNSDCGEGLCELGACVSVATCTNSLDCGSDEVCDDGICVGCITEADCSDGKICHASQCVLSCGSDKDCTGSGLLCDLSNDICVECVSGADCGSEKACVNGSCKPAACQAGAARCVSSGAVICRADELGYLPPVDCDDCSVDDGQVYCGDEPLEGTGPNPSLIPGGTFSSGPGNWRLSGGAPSETPTIQNGAVCESLNSFTLGWPADGEAIDVPAGTYTVRFDLDVADDEDNLYGSVEVKIAGAEAPYEPVLFSESFEELSGTNKSYEHTFTVEELATGIGMAFNVSGLSGGICIDNIRLTAD